MAARVNTKFVVVLIAALVLMGGMAGGLYFMLVLRNSPERRIVRAEEFMEAGDYAAAAEQLRRAFGLRPNDAELLYRFIDTTAKIETNDRQRAGILLSHLISGQRQATQLRPEKLEYFEEAMGLLLHMARDLGDASMWDEIYDRANLRLANSPSTLVAHKYRAMAQTNRIMRGLPLNEDEREQPFHDLTEYLKEHPDDMDALFYMSLWHMVQAQHYARPGGEAELVYHARDEARRWAGVLRERLPDDVEARFHYVRLMQVLGDREIALQELEYVEAKLLENPRPITLVVNVADMLRTVRNEEGLQQVETGTLSIGVRRSLRLLQTALDEHPDNLELQVRLSMMLTRTGLGAQAMDILRQVRQRDLTATPVEALRTFQFHDLATALYCEQLLRDVQGKSLEEREAVYKEVEGLVDFLRRNARPMEGWIQPLMAKVQLGRGQVARAAETMDDAITHITAGRGGDMMTLTEAHIIAAQARQQLGHWGAAAGHYHALLERRPDMMALRLPLAEVYMRGMQFTQAERVLEDALAAEPDNYVTHLLIARLRMAQEELDQAETIYRRLLQQEAPHPHNRLDAVINLGQILHTTERTNEARQLVSREFEKDPTEVRLLQMLLLLTPDEEQQQTYKAMARDAGVDPQTLEVLEISDREQLMGYLQRIEDPFTRHMQLYAVYNQLGDADNAQAELQAAARLKPGDPRVLEAQFNRAIARQDWEEGNRLLARVREADVDLTGGMYYAGVLEAAQGRHTRAIANFQQALRTRSQFPDAWQRLGASQTITGDLTAAAASYRRALDQQPNHTQAILGLADVEDRLGNHSRALEHMRQALRTNPNNRNLFHQYLTYEQQYGDRELALQRRERLAQDQPENFENRRSLAVLYAQMNQTNKAISTAEGILRDDGMTLANVETKMQVLLLLERVEEGVQSLVDYVQQRGQEATSEDWTALARLYWAMGMEQESLGAFDKARELEDPRARPATRLLAHIMQLAGRNDEYIRILRDLWQTDREDHLVAQALATALAETGQPDEADRILQQMSRQHLNDIDTLRARATVAMARRDVMAAVTILSQAIEREPNRPTLYFQRAFVRLNAPGSLGSEQVSQVVLDLERAVQLNPSYIQARRLLAQVHLNQGRGDQAIAQLQSLLEFNPRLVDDRVQLANMLMQLNRWPALNTVLDEAVRLFPQSPTWPLLQGRAMVRQQQPDAAMRRYQQALGMEVSVDTVGAVTGLHLDQGRPREAMALLSQHESLVDSHWALRALRGRALAGLNRESEAVENFRQAISMTDSEPSLREVLRQIILTWNRERALELGDELLPVAGISATNMTQHLVLMDLEIQLQRYAEAEVRANAIDPLVGNDPALRLRIDRTLALVYNLLERYPEAVAAYRRVLEQDPNNPETLNNLAFVLCDVMDQAVEALPYAERAARLMPNDPRVVDTLGWVQFKSGQVSQGGQTLRRALTIQPLPDTYFHLGEVLMSQTRSNPPLIHEARQMFQDAIELARDQSRHDMVERATRRLQEIADR